MDHTQFLHDSHIPLLPYLKQFCHVAEILSQFDSILQSQERIISPTLVGVIFSFASKHRLRNHSVPVDVSSTNHKKQIPLNETIWQTWISLQYVSCHWEFNKFEGRVLGDSIRGTVYTLHTHTTQIPSTASTSITM